jgi:hypothetical protein
LLYRIYVSNLNPTTPTPKLLIEANIPQSVGVNRPALGKCAPKRCDSTYVARFGNVVRWELAGIPANSASVRELRVFIDNSAEFPPPAENTKLKLDVEVKSGGTKLVGSEATLVVQHAPQPLALSVSGTARVPAGGEVDYVLSYGNISSATQGVTLRAALPPGTSVVSASEGAAMNGNTVEWDLGNLAAGNADTRGLRLKLDKKLKPGSFVVLSPEITTRDPKQRPTIASLATWIAEPSPLVLKVSTTPKVGSPAGTVQYQIDVTNTSPNAPTGDFELDVGIPPGTTVNKPQGAKCWPRRCDSTYRAGAGDMVYWKLKSLAPGATVALQFNAVVDKPANAAPPPNGSQLQSDLVAHVHGYTRIRNAVPVGTVATVGRGKPLAALNAAPSAKPAALPKPIGRPK